MATRSLNSWVLLASACALCVSGCKDPVVQREVKVVERWASRWCADRTHEQLDQCKTSDGIVGAVGALGTGDGQPPLRVDAGEATRLCLNADTDAIATLNAVLRRGARVIARGEQITTLPDPTQI